ncbi:MAG: hypothetical protein K0S32_828 [Bacteroidetes bacterium]|jgi:hypothetical protein|nr:hypothetical protein [Bacteroidota bacterium]
MFSAGKLFSQDTITYSRLSKEQYSSWKQIEDKWLKEKFYPFLKKEKIKLSCGGCTSAVIWVVFKKTDRTTYEIIYNKKCGSEFKGKQLAELKRLLDQIQLPEEFNNTYLKVYLGSALKC